MTRRDGDGTERRLTNRARTANSGHGESSHDVSKRCEGSHGPEPKEKTPRTRAMTARGEELTIETRIRKRLRDDDSRLAAEVAYK